MQLTILCMCLWWRNW